MFPIQWTVPKTGGKVALSWRSSERVVGEDLAKVFGEFTTVENKLLFDEKLVEQIHLLKDYLKDLGISQITIYKNLQKSWQEVKRISF